MKRLFDLGFGRADIKKIVLEALREDQAWDDVTSAAFVPANARGRAVIKTREAGVVAGVEAASDSFTLRDSRVRVRLLKGNGQTVKPGNVILEARGPLRSLLASERTALNLLGHLSGVATLTRQFRVAAGKTRVQLLDTRKTLPGLRILQKWAVRCGGGSNHREHLADMALIKENHLDAAPGGWKSDVLKKRISLIKTRGLLVEMECRNRREIVLGLEAGADILLLDNFSVAELKKSVKWITDYCHRNRRRRPLLEASGGVNLKTIRGLARAGVDRISIGQLTHSAPTLNVNMDVFPS
jgi:nicotinate-nucleotide pyrophosphorylase (carboxylating)